ncbi:MAG TPA: SDR family oxidoreductase [Jatrophihabitantaceae bacterium]|nr:SDR family oxidoreductase [Jatrophihabitantaceae bacterium]
MRRPDFSSLAGRRVFITGAASGIGRALAVAAAADGAEVFLTDINAVQLAEVAAQIEKAGGRVGCAKAADIASYEQVRALADAIHADGTSMDLVMDVAGIAIWGTVENLEHRQWQRTVDINLMGPIHVIECFVPPMIAAGRGGHLVNVSSAAGLIGIPWHAAYSASKFGIRGVSEVLRFDLHRHGIGVSVVCPGAVDTGLTETIEVAGVDTSSAQFGRLRARFRKHAATPEQAARTILAGVHRNRYLIYTSWDIRAIHELANKCQPLYGLIMRAVNRIANTAMPMPPRGAAR